MPTLSNLFCLPTSPSSLCLLLCCSLPTRAFLHATSRIVSDRITGGDSGIDSCAESAGGVLAKSVRDGCWMWCFLNENRLCVAALAQEAHSATGTVYGSFRQWGEEGVRQRIHDTLQARIRQKSRETQTSDGGKLWTAKASRPRRPAESRTLMQKRKSGTASITCSWIPSVRNTD
jgi:hypothetical protein